MSEELKVNATVKVRAKAICSCGEPDAEGGKTITLTGVYQHGAEGQACEENKMFGTATPYFNLGMHIKNPLAAAQFESGAEYYVEFVKA